MALLLHIYSKLLRLYPRRFQNEFAEEMHAVFRDSLNEAIQEGFLSIAFVCFKEFGSLPLNILREFWHEFGRKETVMIRNEKMEPASSRSIKASHWEAFLSALPFAVFGVVCMIGKIRAPWVGIYANLIFYLLVLLGLLIGLVKAFPRWAYSYLGWSLLFAWWWVSISTSGLKIFGYTMGDEAWGWRALCPLIITFGIAILWTHSIRPLRELVLGIWQDWTTLSLAMYSFVGFIMLPYDEVHSPYLITFMTASTLLISASVWIFMKSANHFQRLGILLGGFFASLLMDRICATTWDFNTYYGLPVQPPAPWYNTFFEMIVITVVWSPIIWLPVVVGLIRSTINKERTV